MGFNSAFKGLTDKVFNPL